MKHFFIICLITFSSSFCMNSEKDLNKEVDKETKEKKVPVVALPHAGPNYYYDWPGAVPIAYTLVLHEREKRLKRQREDLLPYIPHFP